MKYSQITKSLIQKKKRSLEVVREQNCVKLLWMIQNQLLLSLDIGGKLNFFLPEKVERDGSKILFSSQKLPSLQLIKEIKTVGKLEQLDVCYII